MRQVGGLRAVALAQVQIHPEGEVRLALPALWFIFGKGHSWTFVVAVQAEDELALLHCSLSTRCYCENVDNQMEEQSQKTWSTALELVDLLGCSSSIMLDAGNTVRNKQI